MQQRSTCTTCAHILTVHVCLVLRRLPLAAVCFCLQHFPSILHQLDTSLPKGDIDVKMIDFGTAQLCKDGCSVAEGISGTPGMHWVAARAGRLCQQ